MLFVLDSRDRRPLHEQVVDAIRRAIVEGEVRPGDRLPPARDLASALGINANTVLRALRRLRDEGLLEFRRGRGVSVLSRPDGEEKLRADLRELLDQARRRGYRPEDVIDWIEEMA